MIFSWFADVVAVAIRVYLYDTRVSLGYTNNFNAKAFIKVKNKPSSSFANDNPISKVNIITGMKEVWRSFIFFD